MPNKHFIAVLLLALLVLAGCTAGKDDAYEPAQESPPGPGVLSGEDGVFTIYGEQQGEPDRKTDDQQGQNAAQ